MANQASSKGRGAVVLAVVFLAALAVTAYHRGDLLWAAAGQDDTTGSSSKRSTSFLELVQQHLHLGGSIGSAADPTTTTSSSRQQAVATIDPVASAASSGSAAGATLSASATTAAAMQVLPAQQKSWARRLLYVHAVSKCDNTNAKLLVRRLLLLAINRMGDAKKKRKQL